jgi:uncharacterized protein with HEPN domain
MKKPPRSDVVLLDDMVRFCEMVIKYTSNKAFDDFENDDMCHMAVLHTFVLLGEAKHESVKGI